MSKKTIDLLFQEIGTLRSGSMIIAIAGMEPFLNKDSTEIVRYISDKCRSTGMKFEIITNGLGLCRYMDDTLAVTVDCLHISLDGGPSTYQQYRGASFDKVLSGVEYAAKKGISTINILHTLSSGTIDNIDDMVEGAMSIGQRVPLGEVWFSPFISGKNGRNNVSMVSTMEIIKRLVSSRKFMATDPAQYHLILDDIHLRARGENKEDLFQMILEQYDDDVCSRIIEMGDPLDDEGIVRIAPDGSILHPVETLHGAYAFGKKTKIRECIP
jgi:MoaA/NifB/PqqE/SkfB family radical SAM enzyme